MTIDWRAIAEKVRNWGKWGADDQLGTLNYITPAHVARAAALPKRGQTFSLQLPIDAYGPWSSGHFRRNPVHLMAIDGGDEDLSRYLVGWGGLHEHRLARLFRGPMKFTDDYIFMPLQSGTQWDSLAHVYYDGQLYNGYPSASVTSFGATRDSIDQAAGRGQVVGRGVLLDVAHFRGVPALEGPYAITPEELDTIAAAEGVTVEPGDVVLVRTGWLGSFLQVRRSERTPPGGPGLSVRCAEWLHAHQVAAVAADTIGVEVGPSEIAGVFLPLHMLALRDMGMLLGEMWDLEALSRDCAEDGVYEFLLIAQPLHVTGGVGSPVNPIVIK